MAEFNLEQALQDGADKAGVDLDVFKDKYDVKYKEIVAARGTEPHKLKGGIVLTVEQMAINQAVMTTNADAKGQREAVFFLLSQGEVKLTSGKKRPYSSLKIVTPVTNAEFFHGAVQQDGLAVIFTMHWNNKSFREGNFYRGKLKRGKDYTGRPSYSVDDIGDTQRSFEVPDSVKAGNSGGEMRNFKVISAFKARELARNLRDDSGAILRDENDHALTEPVFKKDKDGNVTNVPLKTRQMRVLVQGTDGIKQILDTSTFDSKWFDFEIDFGQTYKGVFKTNKEYFNLNSPPIKSDAKLDFEDLLIDEVSDFSKLRNYLKKAIILSPVCGTSLVEVKENPDKGTKTASAPVVDQFGNPLRILGDPSIFDVVVDQKGNLPEVVSVIGEAFENDRGVIGFRCYSLKDISNETEQGEVKIDESGEAW